MKTTTLALIAAALLTPMLAGYAGSTNAAPVSKTFTVAAAAKIHTVDNPAAKLADLKVGDKVGIAYHDNNGTLTADKIHVINGPKEVAPKGARQMGEPKPETAELHAHGLITAVDATAGTLTIDVQAHHSKN